MGWLDGIRGDDPPRNPGPDASERDGSPTRPSRRAPALATVFDGLEPARSRSILDVGVGTREHLDLYGRFARRIRFAGLLPDAPGERKLRSALSRLVSDPGAPYDLVLLWDLLDWLHPEQRGLVVGTLARITAPGARLYAVVDTSERVSLRPLRCMPLDRSHVACEPVGPPRPAGRPILPAAMEELLDPFFRTRRAFTLRGGLREYAAVREEPGEAGG